jgi:hypothetical protein
MHGVLIKPCGQTTHTSPDITNQCATGLPTLTTLHIVGDQNTMTNIPLRLFGSALTWHFKTEADLLTFFNQTFPPPHQNSWKVSQPTSAIAKHVIFILRIVPFKLED